MIPGESSKSLSQTSDSSSDHSSPEQLSSPASEETSTKKQKRKHTVLACESCHNNHLKCDGIQPCHQCVKRKSECKYSTPGKRGPKPGASSILKSKLAQQEYSIQILTEELARTKHEKEEWRQKYLALTAGRNLHELTSPIPSLLLPKVESRSSFSQLPSESTQTSFLSLKKDQPQDSSLHGLIAKYFEYFKIYVDPIWPLPQACKSPDILDYFESEDPEHALTSLQLQIVLAHGARMCGAHFHSDDFINSSRKKARDFFHQTSYEVADSFLLMSYFYFGSGDQNKTSYFTALAFKNCETLGLLETTPVGRKCVTMMLISDKQFEEERPEILPKLDSQPDISELIWLIYMQIYRDFQSKQNLDSISLLQRLEEIEDLTLKSQGMSEFETLNIQTLIYGSRSGIFWNEKLKDFAFEWAEKSLRLFNDERFSMCCPLVIFVVCLVTQVHLAGRKCSQLQNDLWVLEKLSSHYPLAELVSKKFRHFFRVVQSIITDRLVSKTTTTTTTTTSSSTSTLSVSSLVSQPPSSLSNEQIQEISSNLAQSDSSESIDIQLILESELDLIEILILSNGSDKIEIPWFITLR